MTKSLNQRAAEMMGLVVLDDRGLSGISAKSAAEAPLTEMLSIHYNFVDDLDDAAIVETLAIERYGWDKYHEALVIVIGGDDDHSGGPFAQRVVTATAEQRTSAAVELHERMQKEPRP